MLSGRCQIVLDGLSLSAITGIKLSLKDGQFAETASIPYDGGLNYRFKDMGSTTEVVTYKGEHCVDAVKFIYDNEKERIKVEYTGGKPYIIYMADADKKAIVNTFNLATVLSDIKSKIGRAHV